MEERKSGIVESIMKSPKIVILVVSILIVLGIYGLVNMNKQEFPEFEMRLGLVVGVYPGATAEQVEEQLTRPLEDFLFTYQEVSKAKTFSVTKAGITYLYVALDQIVDNDDIAWAKIRHGLKDFKAQLPAGVLAVAVNDDFGNTSSLLITMTSKDKSYRELGEYMGRLEDRLRSVPAIGNIKRFGDCHEEISVKIDKDRLTAYGINSQTIFATLFTQGFLSVGGSVDNGVTDVPLVVTTPFASEKEVADQIVYSDPAGNVIRLKDIATVTRGYGEPSSYILKDDMRALVLSVEMRGGNNIVSFGREVNRIVSDFSEELPESVQMYRITDLPKVVRDSVSDFLRDLLVAIAIVILVMLMMFPLRSAMVAAVEIPIVTAITLAVMYVVGMELNTVTLAALIVTLGMIVDDSIVMVDAYIDNVRRGMSRWDAAVHSAKSFFMPLFVATLSISAIFFPFLFTMEGPLGEFVNFFPPMIALSLFISLIMAMLLVPLMEYYMVRTSDEDAAPNMVERAQERFFRVLHDVYEYVLGKCMKHPWLTLSAAVGSVALAVVVFLNSPIQLMPKAERDTFAVEVFLPEGSSLKETERVCLDFEKQLRQDKRVESVTIFVGSSSPRFMAAYSPNLPGSNYAQFIVKTGGNKDTEALVKKYKDTSFDMYPSATVRVKQLDYQAAACPVEVRLSGDNAAVLRACADTLKDFMRTMDDQLVWVHSDCDSYMETIRIDIRPDDAARMGITKSMLSASLALLFGDLPLTTLWEGDYSVAVKLKSDFGPDGPDYEDISNAMVPTAVPGVWVPLRQIATITPDWVPSQITHYNGVPTVVVAAELREGASQPVAMKQIKKFIKSGFEASLPEGVTVGYGGLTAVNMENADGIITGLVAALAILFFFLLFNFGRISLTLLAMASMTLCLLGAFLGLRIFGLDMSLTAIVGIVSLFGINVRNTIILFEYAEELRVKNGLPAKEAAAEAGRRRMRPIFLTSITTAVGVMPMIISRSTLWMPMGVVICFGTVLAIGFVVTVLPVAYWKVFDKVKIKGHEE